MGPPQENRGVEKEMMEAEARLHSRSIFSYTTRTTALDCRCEGSASLELPGLPSNQCPSCRYAWISFTGTVNRPAPCIISHLG